MYYAKDRQVAERVLAQLRGTRLDDAAVTLARLQRIRNEVACASNADLMRLQAWMSIRKLYDAFKAAPRRDLKPLWHDAITKTAAWSESLRV
jgi:hypothetical protein